MKGAIAVSIEGYSSWYGLTTRRERYIETSDARKVPKGEKHACDQGTGGYPSTNEQHIPDACRKGLKMMCTDRPLSNSGGSRYWTFFQAEDKPHRLNAAQVSIDFVSPLGTWNADNNGLRHCYTSSESVSSGEMKIDRPDEKNSLEIFSSPFEPP